MPIWTFTCRACGRTQQQSVESSTRRVRCQQCEESRSVPREAKTPPREIVTIDETEVGDVTSVLGEDKE